MSILLPSLIDIQRQTVCLLIIDNIVVDDSCPSVVLSPLALAHHRNRARGQDKEEEYVTIEGFDAFLSDLSGGIESDEDFEAMVKSLLVK